MVPVVLLTVGLVAVVMLGMGVGVVFSNKELKGSCGGAGGPECACERQGKLVGDCGKSFALDDARRDDGVSRLAIYKPASDGQ
ncbi:MAG: hypothetical protein B7733_08630 [Myxococcales bacterium FL481]|nr:MAG: hypothetical protein B7733_08630 [Myxococcales bacterium FL481]